nr:MAG TPA: hypothetical protein [Caudoviricetes sp.]
MLAVFIQYASASYRHHKITPCKYAPTLVHYSYI